MSRKKIYVLDTSVYLTNADAIYAFKNHDRLINTRNAKILLEHRPERLFVSGMSFALKDALKRVFAFAKVLVLLNLYLPLI
jgi:hypothetical protein